MWDITIEDVKAWGTAIAAIVAAIASCWNLWNQHREKGDLYRVRLGTIGPTPEIEVFLSVISLSKHPITLEDFGYLLKDGRMYSIPVEDMYGDLLGVPGVTRGSPVLTDYGTTFEVGYAVQFSPLGAFAKSTIQERPRLWFTEEATWRQKFYLRAKLLFKPNYHRWG